MSLEILIDKNSIIPIYRQLTEALTDYINNNPPGSRLPSERELAAQLNISRQSVKQALEQLHESGLIRRNGNKGTFTNPAAAANGQELPEEFDLSAVHPMSVREFSGNRSAKQITLALFENYPFQKRFWEHAVSEFNRVRPAVSAQIRWLPRELDLADFKAYSRASAGCDIHQNVQFPELLRPIESGDWQPERDWSWCREIPDRRLFPVYTYFWTLFGNRKLWKKYIGGDWQRVGKDNLLKHFPEWRRKIPEHIYLAEQPLPLINSCGFTATYGSRELAEHCADIERLAGMNNVFYGYRDGLQEKFSAFFSGEEMFFPGCSNYMLYGFPQLGETIFQTPLWPQPGHFSLTSASFLGIAAESRNAELATEFFDFLQSDAIQQEMFRRMNVIPVRRSMLNVFQQEFSAYSTIECESFIESIRLAPPNGILDALGAHVYDFKDLADGRIHSAELLERLQSIFNQ